jgi:hypothetical protein
MGGGGVLGDAQSIAAFMANLDLVWDIDGDNFIVTR